MEDRFNRITEKHGWATANQCMSLLRSVYRRRSRRVTAWRIAAATGVLAALLGSCDCSHRSNSSRHGAALVWRMAARFSGGCPRASFSMA